mmetsp:Transcript_90613/g.228385  ORF Transcript_90613/g.228385 Transcript_90613/m.228385 type:complete len:230 (+) Transcript_90613:488-1177(+)
MTDVRTRRTLESSIMGIWKLKSGLSLEFFQELVGGLRIPLCSAHFMMALSLSSVYCGFLAKKSSAHSNMPSSGRPTGKSTSYFPSLGTSLGVTTASTLAISWKLRHAKGSAAINVGPKLTCTVMFLKFTTGNNGFPCKPSGKSIGSEQRTPSLKRLTVLAFGLFLSRFKTRATTWSRLMRCPLNSRFLSAVKQPSESKQTLASVSPRKSGESCVANPTFNICLGCGILR